MKKNTKKRIAPKYIDPFFGDEKDTRKSELHQKMQKMTFPQKVCALLVSVIALGHSTGSNLSDVAAQSIFVHLQSPESWKTRS